MRRIGLIGLLFLLASCSFFRSLPKKLTFVPADPTASIEAFTAANIGKPMSIVVEVAAKNRKRATEGFASVARCGFRDNTV